MDPTPTYRSPRTTAKMLTAAFVVYAAGLALAALLAWDSLGVAHMVNAGGEVSDASFTELDERALEVELGSVALLIVCAVLFCMWTYRVVKNARALGAQTTISPGWAVGYHFIPILNWWRPYSALAEVWSAHDPRSQPGQPDGRGSGLLIGWWVVWVISRYVTRFAAGSDEPATAAEWIDNLRMVFVSLGIDAVALVLAVAVVWKLTARQEAHAAAVLPAARVA